MNTIRVALLEDLHDIREMLQQLINSANGFDCTLVFGTAEEALQHKGLADIDVILVDVNLPGMNGIEFIRRIKSTYPNLHCIVCSIYEDDEKIFNALSAGATGYLLKNTSPAKLIEGIQEVCNGGSPMSMSVARRVVAHFSQPRHSNAAEVLTPREKEILDLLAQGLLYKEIAAQLNLAKGTVHIHIHNIYHKLQVNNRTEAINKVFHNR
jgi:DNA-binding NarL/FixJ family response regulator